MRVVSALVIAAAVGGCVDNSSARSPDVSALPLVPGTTIVARVRECDPGSSAYCAVELVVVAKGYRTSAGLVSSEHTLLHSKGWAGVRAETKDERAADSPGQKLRVTYATAYGELKGVALGSTKRPRAIALALSRALFDQVPAMAILLELGPA